MWAAVKFDSLDAQRDLVMAAYWDKPMAGVKAVEKDALWVAYLDKLMAAVRAVEKDIQLAVL